MKQPTEEQVKEFWERCGLPYEGYSNANRLEGKILSSIDLNNLFKYAVLNLELFSVVGRLRLLRYWVEELGDNDPALALFWAIYEVVGAR